jgi:hypothetical protein
MGFHVSSPLFSDSLSVHPLCSVTAAAPSLSVLISLMTHGALRGVS